MPLQLQVRQTGLEKSISEGMKKAGRNLKLNLGNTRNIDALSQPLGRLTGKADEFTKSMEAANARVLAFGASVGVIAAVTKGMQELVRTTIEVEKSMAGINSILRQTDAQMSTFKDTLFDVARNTEQTFASVAEAALELSRQGLKAEQVTQRLNDALILSRLSGMSAADSVAGLTAAINSFSSAGITSAEVLNKISAAAASAAVSDRDLIEGLKRSGAVAVSTGVEFDQLLGIIGALQEKTARGGAVIGNSLKTIFTRIQDVDRLKSIQNLGVEVTDLQGNVLSANKVIENLAPTFAKLDQASKVNLADNLVGKFQIAPFLSLLEQYNEEVVRSSEIAATSFGATNEAYERNIALNNTLSAALNSAVINMKELGNTLGEIGVTDNLKNVLNFFNSIAESLQGTLDGEGAGSTFAKGLVKGIGAILSGPGLVLLAAVVTKLAFGFVKFGTSSLKTFFGLNQAAKEHANLQGQITSALLNDSSIRQDILHIENKSISVEEKRRQQAEAIAAAMNAQLQVMQQMQSISQGITPSVAANTKAARSKSAAGGFLPIGAESSDIARGVGGAPSSAKPVVIPNFAFGGGKRGTMVANSSEYIVPNYANGGDAIFNQNMASSMGLPANAKKVRAASGFIPNFADLINSQGKYVMMHGQKGGTNPQGKAYLHTDGKFNTVNKKGATPIRVPTYGLSEQHKGKDVDSFIKDLERYSFKKAIKEAKNLSGGQMPNPVKQGSIKAKVNQGAVAGFAGSIYELAVATLLTDEEFLNYSAQTDTSNFDLNLKGQNKLLNLYGIGTKPSFGEVKGRNNPDNVASTASKIYRVLVGGQSAQKSKLVGKKMGHNDAVALGLKPSGSRKGVHTITSQDLPRINQSGKNFKTSSGIVSISAASGYIPNFADPLQDAIGREKAAGLPVSQIRVNQSGKLRNSQNPMGLAVTNTRDEPTGAIPNFAKPKPGDLTMPGLGIANSKPVENALAGLNKEIRSLNKDLSKGKITRDQAEKSLKSFTAQIKTSNSARKKVNDQAIGALKTGNDLQKGQRDHLGIIFGVQAGLTALNAATGDSTGKLGQLTNAFSEAANTATSFAFAGQALSSLGGDMASSSSGFKKGLGSAIKGLGTVGMVAGAAVGGFKLVNNVIKELDGTNDAIRNESEKTASAMARLEKASDDLTFAFGLVGKSAKIEGDIEAKRIVGLRGPSESLAKNAQLFKTDDFSMFDEFVEAGVRDKIANGLSAGAIGNVDPELANQINSIFLKGVAPSKGKTLPRQKKFSVKGDEVRFLEERTFAGDEGSQAQLKTDFTKIASGFKSLGKTSGEIDAILDEYKSELDASELDLFRLAFQNFAKVVRVGAKNFQSTLDKLSLAELEALVNPNFGNLDKVIPTALKLNGIAPNLGPDQKQKMLQDTLDERRIKNSEKIATINDDIAKARIANAIKIKKLTLESQTEEERILELNKSQNRLGDMDVLRQERALSIAKVERQQRADMLDFVGKEADKIEGIAINEEQVLDIQEAILSGKLNEKGVLKEILGLTNNVDEVLEAQLENLFKGVGLLKEFHEKQMEIKKTGFEFAFTKGKGVFDEKGSKLAFEEGFKTTALDEKFNLGRDISDLQTQNKRINQATQFGGFDSMGMANARRQVNENNAAIAEKNRDLLIAKQTEAMSLLEDRISRLGVGSDQRRSLESERRLRILSDADELRKANVTVSDAREKAALPDPEIVKLNRSMQGRVFEKYGDPLKSMSTLKDDLETASFNFFMNIDNAFTNALSKTSNLGEALLEVAKQFTDGIANAFTKKYITDAFGALGSPDANPMQATPRNEATGGFISGGSGYKDDVPAMLMGGEFVMRKSAVKRHGAGFFDALNNGGVRGYASGGLVSRQRRDEEGLFSVPSQSSGYLKGAGDLMSFAMQSPHRRRSDSFIRSGASAAFLAPDSARLSMFGKRNSPEFANMQDAQRQAFDLAIAEISNRQQAEIQEKENKKQLGKDLISSAVSAGVSAHLAPKFKALQATKGFEHTGKLLSLGTPTFGNLAGALASGGRGTSMHGGLGAGVGLYGEQVMEEMKALYKETSAKGGFSLAKLFGPTANAVKGVFGKGSSMVGRGFNAGSSMVGRGFNALRGFTGSMSSSGKSFFGNTSEAPLGMLPPLPLRRATGGIVPNSAGVDTVPAMLSGGEFIMNSAATKRLGASNLQAMNSGVSSGGDNSAVVNKLDDLILATESMSSGEINITINSDGTENNQKSADSSEDQKRLSEKIKTVVKQVISDEKRLGGQLRK